MATLNTVAAAASRIIKRLNDFSLVKAMRLAINPAIFKKWLFR